MKKWEEEKKKKSGSGGSTSGSKQYERSKFGNSGSPQKPSGSSIEKFNNIWHMYCSKGCRWNCTHTSGFHAAFTSNPSSFPSALPPTHPYHQRIAKEQRQAGLVSSPSLAASPATASIGSANSATFPIDKSKLLTVCEHHERVVTNPTVAAFLSDLKKLLN